MVAQSASSNAKYTLVSIAFMVGSLAIPAHSLFGQSEANPKSDKGRLGSGVVSPDAWSGRVLVLCPMAVPSILK